MSSLDTAAAVRASRDAVLTHQELRGLGVTKAALAHAVKTGVLAHPHREVYVLNDQVVDPVRTMARAALTAGPDGAAVSHLLAGQVYQLEGLPAPALADLTVRHDVGHRAIKGIALHRSDTAGLRLHRGLQLTPVARTLADVAGFVRPGELLSGVDSALRLGLLDVEELLALAGERSHLRNADILRWVAGMADGRSDSPLESWLRMALLDGGLGPVELQILVLVGGITYRIDIGFPAFRLGLEGHGRAFHSSDEAMLKDRRRHNAIQGAGWELLYFSWEDVVDRPAQVVAEVRAALAQRIGRAS
jgi:very-short-patch-repair endonuclease